MLAATSSPSILRPSALCVACYAATEIDEVRQSSVASLPDTMCDGIHAACFLAKISSSPLGRFLAAEADGELEPLASKDRA